MLDEHFPLPPARLPYVLEYSGIDGVGHDLETLPVRLRPFAIHGALSREWFLAE